MSIPKSLLKKERLKIPVFVWCAAIAIIAVPSMILLLLPPETAEAQEESGDVAVEGELTLIDSEGKIILGDPIYFGRTAKIVSVALVDGALEVVKIRDTGTATLMGGVTWSQQIYEVWKDVYEAKDGAIVFKERIEGKYIHPQTTPATWEFPE